MQTQGNPFRSEIENMIRAGDLNGLLRKAGELHGHLCNYLTFGVKAGYYGIKEMGVTNTGMEELLAIVETNNCFDDGIQIVTGCTLGNNSLIYRDYGKTAVTLIRRQDEKAIRLVLKPEFEDSREREYPEAYELFDRLIARREQGNPEDFHRLMELLARMSVEELGTPTEIMFRIEEVKIEVPSFAPILESVKCTRCGENVIKTKIIEKEGKPYCIHCAGGAAFELNGQGISQRAT